MPTTVSFLTVFRRLAREISSRVPKTGTLSGGAAGTIVIASEGYSSASANAYDGVYIYIDAGTGIAQERQVTRAGFTAASGTWAISPNWTVTPVSTDTCIFEYDFRRIEILNAVNRVLAACYMPAFLPIGPNITDIDMETSGVTNWADVATPTTKAKITTASRVIAGTQALNLVVNAATEGVQGPTFDVTAGEQIMFSVAGIGSIGGWIVRTVNMTSGSAVVLETKTAVTELAPTELRFTYTVPADVFRMAIQIIGSTTTSDFALSWAMPIFRNREFVFPQATLLNASKIEGIYYLPQGFSAPTADAYSALTEQLEPWPYEDALSDWRAANAFRIPVQAPLYPLFIKFRRQHATVSLDADLIYVPENLVVEGALSELKKELADRTGDNDLKRDAQTHALTYAKMLQSEGLSELVNLTVRPQERVAWG